MSTTTRTRTCTLWVLIHRFGNSARAISRPMNRSGSAFRPWATRDDEGAVIKGLFRAANLPKPGYFATVLTRSTIVSVAHMWDLSSGSHEDHGNAVPIQQLDPRAFTVNSNRTDCGMEQRVHFPLGSFSGIDFVFSTPQESTQFADYLRTLVTRAQSQDNSRLTRHNRSLP